MSTARAMLVAVAFLLPGAPALAQHGEEDPAEQLDIEGGGHGEHEGHTTGGHHKAGKPLPINWFQWHSGKDVMGGELSNEEQPMSPGILFALFNFAIFLGLLIKFAGPKLAGYLRTRHDTVKGQLEEAARLRAEARAKLDEYNEKIATVDAEVQKLMSEIRAEAEAEKEMILGQARSQVNAMKVEAQRRIEAEVARARLTLEREVASASIAAAEKILRERTNSDDQARMFGTFVDALLAGPPGAQAEAASKVDEEWT